MAIVGTNQLVLQAVIKSRAHIRLVGDAMSIIGAEEVIAREKPDILVVEMAGKIDILERIRKIKISIPSMKIILLSWGRRDALHLASVVIRSRRDCAEHSANSGLAHNHRLRLW